MLSVIFNTIIPSLCRYLIIKRVYTGSKSSALPIYSSQQNKGRTFSGFDLISRSEAIEKSWNDLTFTTTGTELTTRTIESSRRERTATGFALPLLPVRLAHSKKVYTLVTSHLTAWPCLYISPPGSMGSPFNQLDFLVGHFWEQKEAKH